jgi:serine/threonine protein kinase
VQYVKDEKRILLSLSHPHIVNCFAAFQDPRHTVLVLEFVPGGDMYSHLSQDRFTDARAMLYAAEIVSALDHLHRQRIVYRDLKVSFNINSQSFSY